MADLEEQNGYGSIAKNGEKKKLLAPTPAIFRRRSSTQMYLTFVEEFRQSNGGWQIVVIGMLTALGIGSVIGIIPQVATQRYAEELFGYSNDDELCNSFLTAEGKPEACIVGAEYAQSAASVCALVKNIISLLCNPVAGSYSDVHGRRGTYSSPRPPFRSKMYLCLSHLSCFVFHAIRCSNLLSLSSGTVSSSFGPHPNEQRYSPFMVLCSGQHH
jgi:hypothetical protein